MQKLIKNPFFRIIGVIVVLYYGLFYDNSHPDNLKNRLAPEKIKSNLSEISSQGIYIIDNITKAEEIKRPLADQNKTQPKIGDDKKAKSKIEREEGLETKQKN